MEHYDTGITRFLARAGIPGAAVAVSKDGRLVYARGFGYADTEAGTPVQPDSRFRIASISKSITGVAVMKLVEDGLLELDQPAFPLLSDLQPAAGATEDPRLSDVTVRDLLQHSGGWDRDGTGYDPMFDAVNIANAMGTTRPADCETTIRYMRGRPLDFTPGSKYSYSNFGYCVLGRVIERVTGEDYEAYVDDLLTEAGITDMDLGHSLLEDRLPGEVSYYPPDPTMSVFDGLSVPWPYGGFHIEAMDAHGGWVASAVDLLKFSAGVDGLSNRPDLLTPASMDEMSARPSIPTWNGTPSWYGLGWSFNTNGHWWHNGSLPGSESLLVRSAYEGLHWAVLVNHRPANSSPHLGQIDQLMWELALATTTWPTHDLFESFVAAEEAPAAIDRLGLSSVYPNPVSGSSTLMVRLPVAAQVHVEVYDVLGRRVAVENEGLFAAGSHAIQLDASALTVGTYVVRVLAGDRFESRLMTVAR